MKDPRRSTRRLLAAIQRHLTAIYRIDAPARAEDFLLDAGGRARLAARARVPEGMPDWVPDAQGQLLILEEPGALWLGLYLDDRVQERLRARDPYRRLDDANLSPFLTAVEETSHFLYLLWSLRHGRAVTCLELELQGEVDKFAAGALLLAGQPRLREGLDTESLARRLFRSWTLEEGLGTEDAHRYRTASALAARYCRMLRARYLPRRGARRIDRLLGDLRRFYRQGGDAKLRYIARRSRA